MLILRMRQAETALKDGRLDEAFELARVDDVRAHRRGQDLIGRLARALTTRSREHLDAGRLAQASADCDKASRLAGNLPEVAAMRSALEDAAAARHDEDRRKASAIGAAREHIHNGQLSIGGQWLAGVDGTVRADALRSELEARRGEVDAALARAQEAMRHEDWGSAVAALARVGQIHASNPRLLELTAQFSSELGRRVRSALQQGRLDQARLLMQTARPIASRSIELTELTGTLELVGRAGEAIRAGECRRAIEALRLLQAVVPQAAWLEQAAAEAQRAAESIERLRSGPLGMLMTPTSPAAQAQTQAQAHAARSQEPTRILDPRMAEPELGGGKQPAIHEPCLMPPAAPGDLPRKLMLHVDGIGSFLVLRERQVTLGGASGSRLPDVPLLVDSSAGPATLERMDEDYFLTCGRPLLVNNQPVQRKVLGNGDRIALSAKCHIRFTLPNAASTSALLSIAGGRLPGTDATRVVLLDRSLVIGPGSAAHIRADDLPGPVILHVRDGRLFCNTDQEVTVDGGPMDRQAGLPLDAQVRIGRVSMVIRGG